MKITIKCAMLFAALVGISVGSAKADTLQYTLSEELGGGATTELATWTMSSTPAPNCPTMSPCYASGEFFGVEEDVTAGGTTSLDVLAFFNTAFTGPSGTPVDLNDTENLFPELVGAQLYTMNPDAPGCTSAEQCPEMLTGNFMLTSDTAGFGDLGFLLSVAEVNSPEPSSILLLAIGLLALGFAVRKRQFAL